MTGRLNLTTISLLALILAGGLAFRLVFWYGLVNVDPYAYADAAESVARWQPIFDSELVGSLYYTQYLRLSLILPASGLYWAFGPGEAQSIAFPIVASLATGLVAFGLAIRATGDRFAGVVACFITVVFPESVINSTQFLPDTVLAFFSGLAILLFWTALDSRDSRWLVRAALFAGTGAAWALAFYGRQTAVGLALPLAALFIYYRRFDPAILFGVAGALAVGLLMSALLLFLGGEPFEDVRTVLGEGRGSRPGALGYTDLDWSYVRLFLKDGKFIPLTALAVLGAALIAITWRREPRLQRRGIVALGIICAGLFIYFEFLMRLPSLYSWWKEPRYVLTLVPPLAAIAGIGVARGVRMFHGSWRIAAGAAACFLLALLVAVSVRSVRADHNYWEANRIDSTAQEISAVLATRPEPVVFTWDDDLSRYLSFHVGLERATYYDRYSNQGYVRNRFSKDGDSVVTAGSLVVVSPGQESWPKTTAPASHWTEVWRNASGTSVWAVPVGGPAPMLESLSAVLNPQAMVFGFHTTQKSVLPKQHIQVSLGIKNAGDELALRIGTDCDGADNALASASAVNGSGVVTVEVPMNVSSAGPPQRCRWMAAAQDGPWVDVGTVDVGRASYIEPELAFSHDPDTERAAGNTWYRTAQPFYSGGGAAVGLRPFGPLAVSLEQISGDVWVDIGVYDYGDGTNTVTLDLNGVTGDVTWAGRSGVVHGVIPLRAVPLGGRLTLTVKEAGQSGVTIDSIAVATTPPP